ncbi:hypothetical protein IJ847_02395 [Candidatus Saccharibacteria bacterium]|nr:hypothetical protein [Candidatus Saccharibacteria bacterium]
MDGQNANGGGFPLNQNPTPQNPNVANGNLANNGAFFNAAQNQQNANAQQTPFNPIIAPTQNQPPNQPAPYVPENVRSSSIIQSERDNVQAQLDRMHAQNRAATRRVRHREAMAGATRKGVKILVAVIIVVIIALIVVIGFTLYMETQRPQPINHCTGDECNIVDPESDPEPEDPETPAEKPKIGEYQCKTDCVELADMPDGRKIIRDEQIIVVNPSSPDVVLPTTIEVREYESVQAVSWGGRTLVSLKSQDGTGLYSIEDARMLINFGYDSFILDANDAAYANQTYIIQNYVIARKGNELRLVNLNDGIERVSGSDRVFAYNDNVFVGVSGTQRKVFYGSRQLFIADENDSIYYYKNIGWVLRVTVSGEGRNTRTTMTAWSADGQVNDNSDEYRNLQSYFYNITKSDPSGNLSDTTYFDRLP